MTPSLTRALPATGAVGTIQQELYSKYGVRGSFIGQRQVDGSYQRSLRLVCLVDRKMPREKLAREACIPRRLSYEVEGVRKTIQTDVVQRHGALRCHALFNPGDHLRGQRSTGGFTNATIGAFGQHEAHGAVFVTAGHFAEKLDRRRSVLIRDRSSNPAKTISGRVLKFRRELGIDYALIEGLRRASGSRFSNLPITAVYQPALREDIGRTLFVLARGSRLRTVCRGVNLSYRDPRTGDALHQLIITDAVTRGGDSGAALVDEHFRLWGFVIGEVRYRGSNGALLSVSVYMPAIRLLRVENISIGEDS